MTYIFLTVSKGRVIANTNSDRIAEEIEKLGEVEFSSPCG